MSRPDFSPWYKPYDSCKRKKAYISGPMTGYPDTNREAFAEAEDGLVEIGYAVCNPVKTSEWLGEMDHSDYLRFDFERILEADFLVALPGWELSLGAIAEILMATRMGVKVWRWENFEEYDLITYADVEKAISDLHVGNTNPTTVLEPFSDQARLEHIYESYPFPYNPNH